MTGPLDLRGSPHARLRPLADAAIDAGFWAERRALTRDVLLSAGREQLDAAGNLHNLRVAAGRADGPFRGFLYLDSDLYKWLEAVGWEPDGPAADDVIELIEAAQDADGYLNTYYQVARPRERFSNLAWDHELYCAGHLIQAAVAHARGRGDERLLAVARRFADHLDAVFGAGGRAETDGHPEIELALVELHRLTGERRYLALARRFLDVRGHGTLQPASLGADYFQDRVPVREQTQVEGHAVRALYLAAAATDLYLETGEPALLDAVRAQWQDMVAGKTYLTGAVGARANGEAFGDPYELPPDRCYGETCAAIASAIWSWRLLLATGDARYADLLERTLYNGVLAGLALDGSGYSYVNPLHVRDGAERQIRFPWFPCACCPPNLMRLLASLPHYLASADPGGLQVHQYASATLRGPDGIAVRVRTDYPWDGRVELEVLETPAREWTLRLRVPPWSAATRLDGAEVAAGEYAATTRSWRRGERVTLELDLTPRVIVAHPRIDAVRGCAALERGPLVYCFEAADAPPGARVDDLRLARAGALDARPRPDLLGGVVALEAEGVHRPATDGEWPYGEREEPAGTPVSLLAVPYCRWGNRGERAMRVWLPLA